MRESDVAGRYGSEEFLVLLPATDAEGAVNAAEKIRASITAHLPAAGLTDDLASMGVATLPDDAGGADTLMRQADRALYAAKAAGRNRVEVAGLRGRTPTTAPGNLPPGVDAPPD